MKKLLIILLSMILLITTVIPALAQNNQNKETYRGRVEVGESAAVITFTTLPEDYWVFLSVTFKPSTRGTKTITVYDSAGNIVEDYPYTIPAGIPAGWSHKIPVTPDSTYTVLITISEGRARYTFEIDHNQPAP